MAPPNKIDRTGKRYGKLVCEKSAGGGRWSCLCDCGNTVDVLSTNLANYAKNDRGCRHCANRQDITGEVRGLLTAESVEDGVVVGRHPLWTFRCVCKNTVQATVREFRANWVRSCGCHDSTYGSWSTMMGRCYDKGNNRYKYYGGRGITVHRRWHDFNEFVKGMGERPKRHNLGRKHAEKPYGPGNCVWEHVSKNCCDTNNGKPTKPGLKKGAVRRTYQ